MHSLKCDEFNILSSSVVMSLQMQVMNIDRYFSHFIGLHCNV